MKIIYCLVIERFRSTCQKSHTQEPVPSVKSYSTIDLAIAGIKLTVERLLLTYNVFIVRNRLHDCIIVSVT